MYRSFTYDFCSRREILDIQSTWLETGPYKWLAFDNDQYGVYIVAREPEKNLKIRVLGQAPNYSLEIDFDVSPNRIEETKLEVFDAVFNRLLPTVEAADIRDTSRETRR